MPRNELTTGGTPVSATNPLPISAGTGTTYDVSDRAARDLGKVDIAGIDAVGTIAGQKTMANSVPIVIASDQSNVPVTLATTLDSSTDSIDVDKMSKGSVTTAHDAIEGTATSTEIDVRGYNAVHIEVAVSGSGNWDIEITGCAVSGGTFISQYVGTTQLIRQAITASVGFIFPVGANYIKIVATENSGTAAVTVKVTPLVTPVITETAIDSIVSGSEAQVDVVAEIPAGTQIIGKVGIDQTTPGTTNGVQVNAALPAGTNNIGDVDILSIAAGDNNIGNVDIVSLPSGNLGQQAMAASVSVVPASDITDATYIGDVKFGESLPAGTNNIGDMDVLTMQKGSVTTAHNAITATATSAEIDCRGYNAVSVEMACSAFSTGNWVAAILGCAVSSGTFGPCFSPKDDGTFVAQATPAISADGNTTYYFKGIPNYIEIEATRTTDGTLTCKVTPMNL